MRRTHWWHLLLYRFYDSLTRHDPVAEADLIFVLAGKMERKQYGIELSRQKIAPRLLLSIGRFEVSRMHQLKAPGIDWSTLKSLRDRTPAEERHFFAHLEDDDVRFETVRLVRWSSYGEAVGLRQWLGAQAVRRVLVVSTDVHLRRISITLDAIFRGAPVEFLFCPVPTELSSLRREQWWKSPGGRTFVLKEFFKLIGYRCILSLGPPVSSRLMARSIWRK